MATARGGKSNANVILVTSVFLDCLSNRLSLSLHLALWNACMTNSFGYPLAINS